MYENHTYEIPNDGTYNTIQYRHINIIAISFFRMLINADQSQLALIGNDRLRSAMSMSKSQQCILFLDPKLRTKIVRDQCGIFERGLFRVTLSTI